MWAGRLSLDAVNWSKIWLWIDPPPLAITALNYRVLWLVARSLARDRVDIKTGFSTSAL